MHTDYPNHLKEIDIDVWKYTGERQEELNERNYPYHEVGPNFDTMQEELRDIDAYRLSDFWMERFQGGCYWSGIMSAYPWDSLLGNEKYKCGDEEDIWALLLKYHLYIDQPTRGDWRVKFQFNRLSPINGWLRTHTGDGDTPINVETLFITALKYLIKQENFWTWYELEQDEPEEEENVDAD